MRHLLRRLHSISMSNGGEAVRKWTPFQALSGAKHNIDAPEERNVGLVVLNQPLRLQRQEFESLWPRAAVRVFVDGAVNHVSECYGDGADRYMPDIVSGDFDSADESVLDIYRSKGVSIRPTPDQDYTDFHKSLLELWQYTAANRKIALSEVFVLGAFGGRLDHIMANLNVLHTMDTPVPVFLMGEGNIAWLLKAGRHEIDISSDMVGDWCGLVPVGERCDQVTTSGLHWDLDGQCMEMGGLISTSNRLAEPPPTRVCVTCSHSLLWCMGIRSTKASQ